MVKKLLSIIMLLVLVGTVSAQTPKSLRTPAISPLKNSLKHAQLSKAPQTLRAKRAFNLADGQSWFGYWNSEEAIPLGIETTGDYNLAIYIPHQVAKDGATIDGIRFFLATTVGVSNVKVWVSTSLPEPGHYAEGGNLETKPVENIAVGYNEVSFSKGYVIPEGGIYVGFSFDSTLDMSEYPPENYTTTEEYYEWYAKYQAWLEKHPEADPFAISYGDDIYEGSMYFASNYYDDIYRQYAQIPGYEAYLDYVGWTDYSDYGYYLGVEALIGGNKFYQNAATLADFGEKYVGINGEVTFQVNITNSGLKGIQNFTYEVAVAGTKVAEKTIILRKPLTGVLQRTTTNITFPTGDQSGKKDVAITITKVNDQPNEMEATGKGNIIVLTEFAQKKPLVEEYTGTWCGWCTRGWVGLELISKDFEGKAITVAAHNGDPMEIDAYTSVINTYISGFPSMLIDRLTDVDPFHGSNESSYGVKADVEAAIADVAPLSIAVKAEWADQEKTKINIDTETKFFYDDDNPSVAIGYIVIADGLTGTGRSWAQANYYPNYAAEYGNDPYLGELTKMDSYIVGMVYNHVAVAGWGVDNGVNGSISGAVKAQVPVNSTFNADLSGLLIGEDRTSEDPDDHVLVTDLIKDKKVSVVAFLINQNTGEILNADEVVVGETEGISTIGESASTLTERYNAAGQRIQTPQKGLNIIKLSNGKVVKVILK